jgi:PHP family Zn ribbon phosphoesterase
VRTSLSRRCIFVESRVHNIDLVHAALLPEIDAFRNHSFLLTPGGGGRRGMAPLPLEEAVGRFAEEASRWFSVIDLAWPGIEIEKVCPSLRL